MNEEPAIRREDGASGGRYVIDLPEGAEAELTYARREGGAMVANHTYVPRYHRGFRLGHRLVAALVADARREGVGIVPVCPFVAAQFRRHPDWSDVLA